MRLELNWWRWPWFAAVVLVGCVALYVVQRACRPRVPVGVVRVLDPVPRYDPDLVYDIPAPQEWRVTGEVQGVPTVEPADPATRRKVKRAFGQDAIKELDFFYVGELGELPHGADVAVVREKTSAVPPRARAEAGIDYSGLPDGVAQPQPVRLILRPRAAPLIRWDSLHRLEASWEWEPDLMQSWRASYRPGELWVRDWVYLAVEAGVRQRAGESDVYGAVVAGACLGRDCQ